MEKLSSTQQAEVKKMSDVRLTARLTKAGVSAEQLETLDRKGMINLLAEMLVAGHGDIDNPVVSAITVPIGYDVELEKRKFEFEMRKYDEEKEERKIRLEIEVKQWEAEAKFRDQEAEYRKAQLKLQEEREKTERERSGSVVMKLKHFGDALRNSMVKMGSDPIDLLPFF